MNLSLREINYVLTVHLAGNITKAAQMLHIAQPSLSQSLQKIERTLGVQLFSRSGNIIRLTYAGERFVESGLKILQIARYLENELLDIANLDAGRVVLGIPFYLGSYMFPRIHSVYDRLHPRVTINLMEGSSTELETMVANGTVDIAIMPIIEQPPGVVCEPLFKAKIMLSIPITHSLAKQYYHKEGENRPYVDIRLAANEPFLTGQPGQRIRQGTEYIFQKAGIAPPIIFESRSIETIKRLSAGGVGLAFFPDYHLDFIFDSKNAVYCHIEDEFIPDWRVALVYSFNAELSATVKEFICIVKEAFGTNGKSRNSR
jgi:DNA-binding transcriptional LysR family regulator